jgi:hypothetical protein
MTNFWHPPPVGIVKEKNRNSSFSSGRVISRISSSVRRLMMGLSLLFVFTFSRLLRLRIRGEGGGEGGPEGGPEGGGPPEGGPEGGPLDGGPPEGGREGGVEGGTEGTPPEGGREGCPPEGRLEGGRDGG